MSLQRLEQHALSLQITGAGEQLLKRLCFFFHSIPWDFGSVVPCFVFPGSKEWEERGPAGLLVSVSELASAAAFGQPALSDILPLVAIVIGPSPCLLCLSLTRQTALGLVFVCSAFSPFLPMIFNNMSCMFSVPHMTHLLVWIFVNASITSPYTKTYSLKKNWSLYKYRKMCCI